jgi:hypothetical protein
MQSDVSLPFIKEKVLWDERPLSYEWEKELGRQAKMNCVYTSYNDPTWLLKVGDYVTLKMIGVQCPPFLIEVSLYATY